MGGVNLESMENPTQFRDLLDGDAGLTSGEG